ncbi:vWA domain-containing protein [uncultured Mailhella sp.]|uniref:vWA domain-containing protein n=1 Tax=uncultured Mailhella sp. TaxID=1981031 RepID=UPI0025EEFACA|nr:vWA domain-containing protein [uncultured Mailhella sp.]
MNGITELVFILDRSGSMQGLESDTIGGFNAMLEKQRKSGGTVLLSTILFNQESFVLHDRRDIREVPALTEKEYDVSGCTALYDAVGGAIRHIRNIHRYIRPEDVPDHTLFVITTDGLENASTRFTLKDVRRLIEERKEKGWEFLFLGANIDAVEAARDFGLSERNAVDFICDGEGLRTMYESLSHACACFARNGVIEGDWKRRIREDYERRGGKGGKSGRTPGLFSPLRGMGNGRFFL